MCHSWPVIPAIFRILGSFPFSQRWLGLSHGVLVVLPNTKALTMTTSFLAAAFRAYVAEPVLINLDASKPKERVMRFLVMFPDESGKVYLLDKVPSFLQDEVRRKKHFREQEIMPAVLLTILPNGLLWVNNQTSNAMLGDDVSLFLGDANNGLGIAWLLTWGYVTDEIIIANCASQHHVAKLGKVKAHESVNKAKGDFDQFIDNMSRETTKALGLPSMSRAATLKPAAPVAAPIDAPADPKTQTVNPKQSKDALIQIALGKGIRVTKKWSVDRLIDAIASADKAESDTADFAATSDNSDVTVDVSATVA